MKQYGLKKTNQQQQQKKKTKKISNIKKPSHLGYNGCKIMSDIRQSPITVPFQKKTMVSYWVVLKYFSCLFSVSCFPSQVQNTLLPNLQF